MLGNFGQEIQIQFYSQQLERLMLTSSSSSKHLQLLSILYQQNSKIQKLIGHQNAFSTSFRLNQRHYTTDSEHSEAEQQALVHIQFSGSKFRLLDDLTSILHHHSRQMFQFQTQNQKNPKKIQCDKPNQFLKGSLSTYDLQNQQQITSEYFKKTRNQKIFIKQFFGALQYFFSQNITQMQKILSLSNLNAFQFQQFLKDLKTKVKNIGELKMAWRETKNTFGKVFRILSNVFLKKHYLAKIFKRKGRIEKNLLNQRKLLLKGLHSE